MSKQYYAKLIFNTGIVPADFMDIRCYGISEKLVLCFLDFNLFAGLFTDFALDDVSFFIFMKNQDFGFCVRPHG